MYMAPELLSLPDGTYCVDAALDVWAFGVVIFIVLFCEPPWKVASIHLDKRYKRHVKHVIGEGVVDELWTVLAEPFRESLLSMLDVRAHQFNLFVFVLPFVALFLPLRTFSLSVLHAAEFHCCPFSPHLLLRPIHGYCMALMIQQALLCLTVPPHTHARTHKHTHAHTHTHTWSHTHTHTHTHTLPSPSPSSPTSLAGGRETPVTDTCRRIHALHVA
jgi:serine/threonine protein kinase